ncbi:MAG TPA: hypothetical protein VGE65_07095 [Sphingobium sp.]
MQTQDLAGPGRAASWIIAQTFIVAFVTVAALLAPPESGSILLLPIGSGDPGLALRQALAHGAQLEGAGPISGTFVVHGSRDRLAPAMLSAGVLMLSARPLLCGKPQSVAA